MMDARGLPVTQPRSTHSDGSHSHVDARSVDNRVPFLSVVCVRGCCAVVTVFRRRRPGHTGQREPNELTFSAKAERPRAKKIII